MKTRRQFLTSLLGFATLPFVARALGKPSQPVAKPVDWAKLLKDAAPNQQTNRAYEVQGIGVKVPSNRFRSPHFDWYDYVGKWDGTFKVEQGCANPAWIWLSLLESAYPGRPTRVAAEVAQRETCEMDYQVLYRFGQWCDEIVIDWETQRDHIVEWDSSRGQGEPITWQPRYQVNTLIQTEAERAALKDGLRMRFLSWRASDPRYQRSFPGIPHPLAHRTAIGFYV